MQKGVAFITYVYKAGIKPGHDFFYLCNIDVSNRERSRARLALILHQIFVFQQGNRNIFLLNVNYNFAGHFLIIKLSLVQ